MEKTIFDAALDKVRHLVKPARTSSSIFTSLKAWPVQKVARTLGVNAGRVYLAKHRIFGFAQEGDERPGGGYV